jgi:hypothetical protein
VSRHHSKKQLPDGIELGGWDHAVSVLLGPRLAGDDPDKRKGQALELAAAALRAAGENTLAANLLD